MLNEIIWCCTICRPKVKKIIGIIDAIDDKLNEVDNIINEFKTTVNTRLEKLENNLEDKSNEVQSIVENKQLKSKYD